MAENRIRGAVKGIARTGMIAGALGIGMPGAADAALLADGYDPSTFVPTPQG